MITLLVSYFASLYYTVQYYVQFTHVVLVCLSSIGHPAYHQSGFATWYGEGNYHGSHTATREKFDPYDKTCAHRSVDLGSTLYVFDQSSDEYISCRVNDRGPYAAHKEDGTFTVKMDHSEEGQWRAILDLSKGAAQTLSNYSPGPDSPRPPNFDIELAQWNIPDMCKVRGWTPRNFLN